MQGHSTQRAQYILDLLRKKCEKPLKLGLVLNFTVRVFTTFVYNNTEICQNFVPNMSLTILSSNTMQYQWRKMINIPPRSLFLTPTPI